MSSIFMILVNLLFSILFKYSYSSYSHWSTTSNLDSFSLKRWTVGIILWHILLLIFFSWRKLSFGRFSNSFQSFHFISFMMIFQNIKLKLPFNSQPSHFLIWWFQCKLRCHLIRTSRLAIYCNCFVSFCLILRKCTERIQITLIFLDAFSKCSSN